MNSETLKVIHEESDLGIIFQDDSNSTNISPTKFRKPVVCWD